MNHKREQYNTQCPDCGDRTARVDWHEWDADGCHHVRKTVHCEACGMNDYDYSARRLTEKES